MPVYIFAWTPGWSWMRSCDAKLVVWWCWHQIVAACLVCAMDAKVKVIYLGVLPLPYGLFNIIHNMMTCSCEAHWMPRVFQFDPTWSNKKYKYISIYINIYIYLFIWPVDFPCLPLFWSLPPCYQLFHEVKTYQWEDASHTWWQPWISLRPNRQLPEWTNCSYGIGCFLVWAEVVDWATWW